ncbi:MAG: DUF2283 domain-containing protein [Bacteroidetes bacterium]|nr:DUF2283 domain-containing protein [Bacteroidota bacterium]
MAKEIMQQQFMRDVFQLVPHVLDFPMQKIWFDYDREADVLYISFRRPQKATNSEMLNNGTLLRYSGDKLIGITILDASQRKAEATKNYTTHLVAQEPSASYGKHKKKK